MAHSWLNDFLHHLQHPDHSLWSPGAGDKIHLPSYKVCLPSVADADADWAFVGILIAFSVSYVVMFGWLINGDMLVSRLFSCCRPSLNDADWQNTNRAG